MKPLNKITGSLFFILMFLAACTQTQPKVANLTVTGTVGSRIGTPKTGSYARGEKLTTMSFYADSGVGPVFNKNACKWCHSRGGVGGAGDRSNRVELYAAILVDDGTVDADDRRRPLDIKLLEDLGGPILHRAALGDKDRLPTQAEIDEALGQEGYRLTRTARVGNPIFGTGLLSAIPNDQIKAYAYAQRQSKLAQALNITGRVHYLDGGFIGRLGWKAQVPSTLNFIAGATVEEVGLAHNRNKVENVPNGGPVEAAEVDLSDQQFLDMLAFNNFVAPPTPINQSDSRVQAGKAAFEKAGCAVCHAASPYTTGDATTAPLIPTASGYESDGDLYQRETALHNKKVNAYSDLLMHDMGSFLADGFRTGAVGDEAPKAG